MWIFGIFRTLVQGGRGGQVKSVQVRTGGEGGEKVPNLSVLYGWSIMSDEDGRSGSTKTRALEAVRK